MPRTDRFAERIGAVFLPEAETVEFDEDFSPNPEGPIPFPDPPFPDPPVPQLPQFLLPKWPPDPFPWPPFKVCSTRLKQGCYTISFAPTGTPIFGTRYRGTLRVEHTGAGVRFSGDLYTYRLLDDLVLQWPERAIGRFEFMQATTPTDNAADTGGTIPIYRRRRYHSYLKGTKARLFTIVSKGDECSFSLELDEFVYNHPATGFSGSFNNAPTRSLRYVLKKTGTPDLYSGDAYVGLAKIGTVSIRWVSPFYRRAHLQINTLQGAETPPAVDAATFATIFADLGWDLTVTDGGTVNLPAELGALNINQCWSSQNLHTLMSSVPGYNPAGLDSAWRVHLISVPAALGCSRGVMFDSSLGADPNAVPREGSATFSRDGYPANDVPDGMGGSHYDTAADQQQRNVPRAFLRSATHEVGHAFNQIHQGFESGNDNSIMTPTPGVASVLGLGGTFPDQINLTFNATVKKHLRHLPDPAVRPGAMDFFGAAIAAPEAADVAWLDADGLDAAELDVTLNTDHVRLGEPVTLRFELRNAGHVPLVVPASLDAESLTVRISVTDPTGRVTFMRPEQVQSCPRIINEELPPESSVSGETTLFWGRDGFAFETPGRHVVEVIVLWDIVGVPVAVSAERDVSVAYPISAQDNDVAALMLDPAVGAAVAAGDTAQFERAKERIKEASEASTSHPAVVALDRLGLLEKATARKAAPRKAAPKKAAERKGSTRRRKGQDDGR